MERQLGRCLSQNAHYTDLNVRVSGGSKTSKYFVSAGYMDDQGAYICSGFKRYTLRANITSDIRKWLQVGLNVSGTHSIQDYPKQDDSTISTWYYLPVQSAHFIRYTNVI